MYCMLCGERREEEVRSKQVCDHSTTVPMHTD